MCGNFNQMLGFLDDLEHNGKKKKKIAISINHHTCIYIYPIFHVENNLSKVLFKFYSFYLADFDLSWACLFVKQWTFSMEL
jgi:hypothetical protein